MKRSEPFSVLLLLAVGLTGGCGSGQMSRIDRNRAIYETWPLETKQAVLDGKVEPGMNADMVRVAWGDPSQVSVSPAGDEIWVFTRGGDPGSVYYPGGMGNAGGIGMGSPGIGISTGRGGTAIGATGGIGMGGTIGGPMGVGGMGGMGSPIVTAPTPPEVREVVFRNGVVLRADPPFNSK